MTRPARVVRLFLCFCLLGLLSVFFLTNRSRLQHIFVNVLSETQPLIRQYKVNFDKGDVIVFLHIPKTGGTTFGKHLARDVKTQPPCKCPKEISVAKNCRCVNKYKHPWLFSRFTLAWPCGVHADWTELTSCVGRWYRKHYPYKKQHSNRRFLFVTMLREPVPFFLSQWLHYKRYGGKVFTELNWLKCNGKRARAQEAPHCFYQPLVLGNQLSLEKFMACRHNRAFNHQTYMLANLKEHGCFNPSKDFPDPTVFDEKLLESAKRNLKDMAFFGITEFQRCTQWLFEFTFGLKFTQDFVQNKDTNSSQFHLSKPQMENIQRLNTMDFQLYEFARELFLARVRLAYQKMGLTLPKVLCEV